MSITVLLEVLIPYKDPRIPLLLNEPYFMANNVSIKDAFWG